MQCERGLVQCKTRCRPGALAIWSQISQLVFRPDVYLNDRPMRLLMATYGCNAAPSGICFLASEKRSTIRVVRVTSARFPSSPFSHVVALYEKPYKCEKKKRVVLIVESCFYFSRVLRDSTPRYVRPSVGPSVLILLFYVMFFFKIFWLHCSCLNAPVT